MRPKIICHMVSSVDGRLDTDFYTKPFDEKDIDTVMDSYFTISNNYQADAIMIGRKTVQQHYFTETYQHKGSMAKNHETFIGDRDSGRLTIIIDPQGKILYTDNQVEGENMIAILSERVSEDYLTFLRGIGISYLFAGEDGRDIVKAVDTLGKDFGMKTILLEGGGIINGTFLKAGLIDELSLMIYPGIDGLSGRPAIFEYFDKEGEMPAKGQSLEFVSSEVLNDGIVRIQYKFHHNQER